jgi:hypothetical protein
VLFYVKARASVFFVILWWDSPIAKTPPPPPVNASPEKSTFSFLFIENVPFWKSPDFVSSCAILLLLLLSPIIRHIHSAKIRFCAVLIKKQWGEDSLQCEIEKEIRSSFPSIQTQYRHNTKYHNFSLFSNSHNIVIHIYFPSWPPFPIVGAIVYLLLLLLSLLLLYRNCIKTLPMSAKELEGTLHKRLDETNQRKDDELVRRRYRERERERSIVGFLGNDQSNSPVYGLSLPSSNFTRTPCLYPYLYCLFSSLNNTTVYYYCYCPWPTMMILFLLLWFYYYYYYYCL